MSSIEPVRKQIVVEVPQERAFRVFTDGIDRWWPKQHHIGKSPLARSVLEPRVGGRWYGVCEDGTECDVGKVLSWEPPRRVVLAWQITAQWQFDPGFLTEVEVTFTAETPNRTRVELEHRNLERYGVAAVDLRNQIDQPGGWRFVMEEFGRVASLHVADPMQVPGDIFFYTLHPTRLGILTEGPTPAEQAVVGQHWAYLQRLLDTKVLVFGGRTLAKTEDSFATVVVRAASEGEAQALIDRDPAVQGGVFRARLYRYQPLLMGAWPLT